MRNHGIQLRSYSRVIDDINIIITPLSLSHIVIQRDDDESVRSRC